ncbi:DNA-binding transcriptional regulator, LysR family [Paracoccus isoporae]|uniref:DNA-binding transcriptional regulator, LysR family n=1 Tax=Paracoccus isoporae TaxID=591205 RepID=A0A1G6XGA8_9RHOB|nr:LysR family transcriptional regulator [Paracoccus isoporae]SDD77264.1 DNA-binding transcriptional regulator, LysR family [Paracoccus isoporae]
MRYSLDDIETFLTVMELGTVTAAAARLNLSKSVVSKRISEFEATLGAALFRRNAGRITPTDGAARLAERLRPALSELVAATESAGWGVDGAASLRGRLSIAAPMSFGTMYLAPVLARFAARFPDLDLRIEFDDRLRDLARDGFDLGIRIGAPRDTALMSRKLCEDRAVIVASPDYLSRHGRPDSPAALGAHQVIGYSHVAQADHWQFAQGEAVAPTALPSRLSSNNGEMIRAFALSGQGLARLPCFIVADGLRDGSLVELLPDHPTPPMPITAVWPTVTPMPAKLRVLIDHLAAELAGGAPWQRHASSLRQPG